MYANRGGSGAPGNGFVADFADLARSLRASVPDLSESEKHLLKDLAEPGRYRWVVLQSVMSICSRSTRAEDRESLAEMVRRACLVNTPKPATVAVAFDEETLATDAANIEQRRFERAPSPSTYQRVRDTLTRQYHATRLALDAIHLYRPATPHWSKLPEKGAP